MHNRACFWKPFGSERVNTMNNYIQTLQTKTSDLKQGKRPWLLYKIEFLCKSTLVSEFKNYVDFALTKVAFDTFKINKKKVKLL